MKKVVLILAIAAAHFTLSKAVPVLTLLLMDTGIADHPAGRLLVTFLVYLTKALFFPILSFALYPRHWFPGYWINSVIWINSLLWAVAVFLCITLYRRFKKLV